MPLSQSVAAVSCGVVDGRALLDLDYSEDSTAEVDANVVMTGDGGLVEVQATAERTPLSRASLDELLALAASGIERLRAAQQEAVGAADGVACGSSSPPATSTSCASWWRRCARTSSTRCPTRSSCRPRPAPPSPTTRSARRAPPRRATGRPAIADDSASRRRPCNGAPGVWSARYAGEDATDEENLAKLLREVPPDGDTRVAYVCAMAFVEPGGRGAGGAGALRGNAHPRAARQRRLRLRPRLRARRLSRRRAHDGRARRPRRRTRSATAAAPRASWRLRLTRAEEEARPRGPLSDLFRGARPVSRDRGRRARAPRTALLSVGAAVLLVTVKLVTGLVTGSLAFVAEAVHSGTDLVAALLTLFAVRVAVRPPDREHQYGHGKAEHLAALGESAFLILVSVAIAAESLRRLITGEGHGVEAAWWAFAVLAVVIALDASRALASRRAARRFARRRSPPTPCTSAPTWPARWRCWSG